MSQSPKEVTESLPQRFIPEKAGDWKACIQLNLTGDDGGTWYLQVAGDGNCSVRQGEADAPTATVTMPGSVWVGISDGSINPMGAFMKGQIKIKGKMSDVTRLNDPRIFAKSTE